MCRKVIFLSLMILSFLLYSCKKDGTKQEVIPGDGMSDEDNLLIESASVPNPPIDQIIKYEGNRISGAQGIKADLVNTLIADAQALSGAKIIMFRGDSASLKPDHLGYVYAYGSRDISVRDTAKAGDSIHRKYFVFGTDCSGLQIILLQKVGIYLDLKTTVVLTFEQNLKSALKNTSLYPDLEVKKYNALPENEIKHGDYILWLEKKHMGIICKLKNGQTIIYQSNGNPNPGSEENQKKNYSLVRGIHPFDFQVATTCTGCWGANYIILRLQEKEITDAKLLLTRSTWQLAKVIENGSNTTHACEMDDEYKFNTDGSFWMTPNTRCRPNDGTLEDWGCNCSDGWKFENNNTKLTLRDGGLIQGAIMNYYFRSGYNVSSFGRSVDIKKLTQDSLIVFDQGVNVTLEFKAK